MSNPSRLRTSVECRMGRLVGCGPAERRYWIGFLIAALAIVGAIDDVRAQPSSGACCLPNGTCTVTNDPFVCRDQNGIFRGDATCAGVICTGACCLPNGSCTSGSSQNCTSAAGEFKGFGSLCANQVCGGACCLADKSCTETGPGNCTSLNGLFQGLGTICGDDCPSRLTTAFTYQGQLKLGGVPLADTVNLDFSLWTLAIGGTQLGSTLSFSSVEVVNGLLQVELDFGPNAFLGNSRWLQIVVDGTPLSPRQTLTAAPYAIRALSAGNGHALDAADGSPTQAVSVDNFGFVGIGTTSPSYKLDVRTSAANCVYGETSHSIGRGVQGRATAPEGVTYGGQFQSDSTTGRGVFGTATAGTGYTYGVHGQSASTNGRGVIGSATADTGPTYGGRFESASTDGHGVIGSASAATGTTYGVIGSSNSAAGYDFYAGGAGVNYGASSSIRWKSNVRNIEQPLEKVARLRGVYFDWDAEHGGHHDLGMVAEEVGKVLPEIVNYEENGTDAHGMDYSKLTPLLVEAVKAIRRDNLALQKENETIRARLAAIESALKRIAVGAPGGEVSWRVEALRNGLSIQTRQPTGHRLGLEVSSPEDQPDGQLGTR